MSKRSATSSVSLLRPSTWPWQLTRDGRLFVLLIAAVSFGAFNTNNNLLYLILGAMLALFVASILLAELSLRGLQISRTPPDHLFAGQETFVTLRLHNRKTRLPSFNVAVRETFGRGRTLDPVLFLHVPPGRTQEHGYRCVFPRRGRCRFRGWRLETRFPFGLLVRRRHLNGPAIAIVYPPVEPLQTPLLREGGLRNGQPIAQPGISEEFFALRDFRLGDDARRIAWKASARRGIRLVREFEREGTHAIELVIVNVGPNTRRDPLFEAAIIRAASLAIEALRAGFRVGLTALDHDLPLAQGRLHQQRLLTSLALMRYVSASDPTLPSRLTRLQGQVPPRSAARFVITTPHADHLPVPPNPHAVFRVETPPAPHTPTTAPTTSTLSELDVEE